MDVSNPGLIDTKVRCISSDSACHLTLHMLIQRGADNNIFNVKHKCFPNRA